MKKSFKDRHHLFPKSRHAELKPKISKEDLHRTVVLWRHKHQIWHILFKDKTILEIIELLKRVERITKRKGGKK